MPGATFSFSVLGPLTVERDGKLVTVSGRRPRALLALLLAADGPVSRDSLIDQLWNERPPASAVSALHVHLAKLRAALGDLLVLSDGGYALASEDYELDAWEFDRLVDQARSDEAHAGELLRGALSLFRGAPLADVACDGAAAQWRRTLADKREQALAARIDADLADGDAEQLVPELERLVLEYPLNEKLWGQLMLALYRAGRPADALETYQRARSTISEELGIELGEPLKHLQRGILDRDHELLGRARIPGVAAPSGVPWPLTPLIGRERELGALSDLMSAAQVRLLTVAGPGGVGKTRLAIELAHLHEGAYRDGAIFIGLERLSDPALVSAEIDTAIAGRDGVESGAAVDLPRRLRSRELLVVIDNFEHLLPAAVQLVELLALAPQVQIVVTSRTPLRVRGEQVFELEPLALPSSDASEELARSPAVRLFVQCAQAVNPALTVDDSALRAMARICAALDGLPLAIELACSRLAELTLADMEDQIGRALFSGSGLLRDLPERQQTLQATIRWSYDLLGADAREALCVASVFRGGFDRPALEAIAAREQSAALHSLIEASLVRRSANPDRFELLELVRAFALEELDARGESSRTRARHRRYFGAYVTPASRALEAGRPPAEIAATLQAEHPNLRAALEDALVAGDRRCATAIALGLRAVWVADSLRDECQSLIERLRERFELPAEEDIALLKVASFFDHVDTTATQHRRFTRLLMERAAQVGDREALALATCNLFSGAVNARDRAEMRRLKSELLKLDSPELSELRLGWVHYSLAIDAYVDNHFELAIEHAARSVVLSASAGHSFNEAAAVGIQLLARSAHDQAISQPALAHALAVMQRPGVKPVSVIGLWFVARYAAAVDTSTARGWLGHAERLFAELDAELWPESELRDETLALLEISAIDAAAGASADADHAALLAQAADWVSTRSPSEQAPRPAPHALAG